MKLTFLGVAGFLSEGFQSNMLFDTDSGETLLLDCGTDIKHSLKAANREVEEIDAVYISHLHGDHCSIEWLAYYAYFITKKKIDLFIHESLLSDLWNMLSPSMSNHKRKYLRIDDYFNVKTFADGGRISFSFGGYAFNARKLCHVRGKYQNVYSYALMVDDTNTMGGDESLFYISFDTDEIKITDAKYIFYDCDVMSLSGVHPNYFELKKINDKMRKKVWLYHYTDLSKYNGEYGEMPNAVGDGFAGFVKEGQIFELDNIGKKVKEVLRDGPNIEKFKPEILKEKGEPLKWGAGHPDAFGSPGFVETEVKKDETIYSNNNKNKPFDIEGLEQKRKQVEENRKDNLDG